MRVHGRILFPVLLLLVLGPGAVTLRAQASLVPAYHPVYEWLHHLRVRGILPRFNYEALPLTRGGITALLDSAATRENRLSFADRALLASFRAEFVVDTTTPVVTLLQGGDSTIGATLRQKVDLILSDRIPHLYRYTGTEDNATVDYTAGLGWFAGSEVAGTVDKFEVKRLEAYGTLRQRIGFHVDLQDASSSSLFRFHPQWRSTAETEGGSSSTVWGQGFATAALGAFQVDIGTGTQRVGAPARQAVILQPYSANFDWVRLSFNTRVVQYSFTHGSLVADPYDTVLAGSGLPTRVAPARWIAVRRLQIRPDARLQLGFTETLTYSNRGVDLAYLNPIYPLRFAEFNTNGRDDPVWYLDAVIRPVSGLEVSGTLGIDDMYSFADWLRPTGHRSNNDLTTKLLYQAWSTIAMAPGTDVYGGYVRVEPFFYTHILPLNTYEQWHLPLGAEVGPNGDEWTVGVRQWLPWRGSIAVSLSGGRHGLNPVDSLGNEIADVGGSLTSRQTTQRVLFLAGDVHHTRTIRVDGEFEPFRGIRLEAHWEHRDVTLGTRLPQYSVLRIQTSFMFYPFDVLLLPF